MRPLSYSVTPVAIAASLTVLSLAMPSANAQTAQPSQPSQPTASAGAAKPQTPADAKADAAAKPEADDLQMQQIIVQGRGTDWTKFKSSYSVSTFSEKDVNKLAPASMADLLVQVPGFFTNAAGGEIGNNLYARGLPNGNYRYVPLLEDGLPVWEEGAGAFTNADLFARDDATIKSVQVVRGGTAAILANNAPGGSVNMITKKGTETLEGLVKLEIGDNSHVRTDFNLSGPINDKILFQIGGFQRIDNGIRNAGFTGNKGGQFRGGLTFKMNDGQLYLGLKNLDDHNIFYTNIPMQSATQGLPGLSAQYGTLMSPQMSSVTIPDGLGGWKQMNLDEGVHTKITSATVLFDKDLSDTVSIHDKFRRTSGYVNFNALFGQSDSDASQFLNQSLATLQGANPAVVTAAYQIFGGNGQNIAATGIPNSLVSTQGIWNTYVQLDNYINDLSLTKDLDTSMGQHQLTFGVYLSHFDQQQNWNWNNILTEATNQSPLLNVVGLNAAGQAVESLGVHGLVNLNTNLQEFRDHVTNVDWYWTDNWQVTKALRIDGGMRLARVNKNGLIAQTSPATLITPVGSLPSVATQGVAQFTGAYTPYAFSTNKVAYSVGANYELSKELSTFVRASKSFRVTPEFAQWFGGTLVEDNIKMLEGGLKFATPKYSAFLTAFYNNFPDLNFQYTLLVNNVETTQTSAASARAMGLESEFVWRPVSMLDIFLGGVLQRVTYTGFSGTNPATGLPYNYNGHQVSDIPDISFSLRPTLHIGDNYDAFANIRYVGKIYQDVANTVQLPAYNLLDLGVAARLGRQTRVQLVVKNALNKASTEQGNPRNNQVTATQEGAFDGTPNFGRTIRASIEYSF